MAETPATAMSTASLGGISQLVGHENFSRHNPMSDRFEVGKEGGRKGQEGRRGRTANAMAPHANPFIRVLVYVHIMARMSAGCGGEEREA